MKPESKDDPHRSCTVTVDGPVASDLVSQAIGLAASFLLESPDDLYASHVGDARPIERSRFHQHLGVPAPVIRWSATITVRLLPEVVRERREKAEEARNDDPDRPGKRSRPLKLV